MLPPQNNPTLSPFFALNKEAIFRKHYASRRHLGMSVALSCKGFMFES